MTDSPRARRPAGHPGAGLWTIVGFLIAVEIASGVLQGFYTPIITDIADHLGIAHGDVNWFEAAQLMVSALAAAVLTRLGDRWGHRNVLLLSTAITAAGSWMLVVAPNFWTFLVGWAVQGAYVVWLPVEVAIIHRRTRDRADRDRVTRRAAALLVAALETGVIIAAVTSGLLVQSVSIPMLLAMPAIAVTLALVVILLWIEPTPGVDRSSVDVVGLLVLTATIGLVMAGLVVIRLLGPGSPWPWLLLVGGIAVGGALVAVELRVAHPLIDVRLLADRAQWPIQLTAFLFGMSVLGAQIPLSTFARADPQAVGYGLGASAAEVSTLVGAYVITLVIGALLLPVVSRGFGPRGGLAAGALLVAAGYGLFVPSHDTTAQVLINLGLAGIGSGILIAGLPAAAAASAPEHRTGFATGMTNAGKTVGGGIASAIFAIALTATGSLDDPGVGSPPLSGYLTIWTICAASALVAAVLLLATDRAHPVALSGPDDHAGPVGRSPAGN